MLERTTCALTTALLLAACSTHGAVVGDAAPVAGDGTSPTSTDDRPPAICRAAQPVAGPWFTEVTDEVGLGQNTKYPPQAGGIVAADIDGDGWVDFYASPQFVFMNRPHPQDPTKRIFVNLMDPSGASDPSGLRARRDGTIGRNMNSVSFGDLDNDGDLDVIGCDGSIDMSVKDSCAAFLNDGTGHFTLAPRQGDLESDVFASPSVALLDYDLDGVLDVWPATIGKWQYGPAPVSRMRLYRGTGDGTFTDVSAAAGLPSTPTVPGDYRMTLGVTSCDIDQDGDRDVILAAYGVPIGPNHVFRNDNGKFVEVAHLLGVDKGPGKDGGFTFSVTCGDLDDNGTVDLYTAELQHAWYPTHDHSEPLLNVTPRGKAQQPYKRPGRDALGLGRPHVGNAWTEGDSAVHFVDVDLDGRKDVYVVSVNYPQQNAADPDWTHSWLYQQQADGKFVDVTDKTPFWDKRLQSIGNSALIDIDNDGDLDIVTGTNTYNSQYLKLTPAIHVFRNNVGQAQNMIRIRLIGKGRGHSNVSAIGARVEVTAGGRTQQQEVLGHWGSTQSDMALTFGLGQVCEVDKIAVYWPNAKKTVTSYEKLRANYLVELREGQAAPTYRTLDGRPWRSP